MGSFLTSATGTGNSFAAASAPIIGQDFKGNLQNAQDLFNKSYNNESSLGQTLAGELSGAGPNPAMAESQQMNENAIKSNAGFLASQKGISPALAQRAAALNSANMQQGAANQGAINQMNQQMSLQGALGNLYGSQANQASGQQSTLQNALASYNNAQVGNTSNMNNANAGVAAQNAATAGGLVGGLTKGVGGLTGLFAKGGVVPEKFDSGGMVTPAPAMANWGYNNQPMVDNNAVANMTSKYISAGADALKNGLGSMNPLSKSSGGGQQVAGGPTDVMTNSVASPGAELGDAAPLLLAANKGGVIPGHLQAMAKIYHPDFANKGGSVPGKAKVNGNSLKNDTVPAMLSPGEIVLPRTVTESKDPVKAAAEFVASKLKTKGSGSGNHVSDFHDALKKAVGQRRSK